MSRNSGTKYETNEQFWKAFFDINNKLYNENNKRAMLDIGL